MFYSMLWISYLEKSSKKRWKKDVEMFGWNTKTPYLCIRFRERNDSSPGHKKKRYLKELHKQRVVQEQDI